MAAAESRIIQVEGMEGTSGGYPVQPPAQRRPNFKVTPGTGVFILNTDYWT